MAKSILDVRYDFMGQRRRAVLLSALILALAVGAMAVRGFNFGLDFTGGTLIEVGYQSTADLNQIRQILADSQFTGAVVQHFGSAKEVLIRLPIQSESSSAELSTEIMRALSTHSESVPEMRRVEFVGPQVGQELSEKGGLALLYALGGILLYISVRFEKRFALGAVAALVHDVLITLGFFALFQIEFDITVIAAVLAVIGYSLNDTIVVFDRIRENFRRIRKGSPVEVLNVSLNQTISRTLVTSLTTLVVLIALLLFGGELIRAFAIALIIGVLIGTYSSIFIASTTALALGISKADLMPVEKEGVSEGP
ncbi:MAG TPA: protein translocase subunit SecF [Gammaproteobacteria bacterium]|nr:protein translocase subunit SecF [Gammaproteobacteria bacterium]